MPPIAVTTPTLGSVSSQVEQLKQGMDQKLQGGQEKLQQMWLEWSKKQPGGDKVPPEVGGRAVGRSPGPPGVSPPPLIALSPRSRWSRERWPCCRA